MTRALVVIMHLSGWHWHLSITHSLRASCQVNLGVCVDRDLKPENVLIDDRGDVKICDFGLSRLISTDSQMTVQVRAPVVWPLESKLSIC
jgi:serine/threonine protein kinase